MTQIVCVFLISVVCFICIVEGEPAVKYFGCFEDGGPSNRLMADDEKKFDGNLTPDICNEHCRGKGFPYAGTQYSIECFCSKTKPPDAKKTLESDCSSKCSGDDTKTCGGNNRLAVFSTGFPDPTGSPGEVLRPIGCFKDSQNNRLLSGYRQDFHGSLTNQKCVRLCERRGYHYAGTEYGRECHCGNKKPTFKDYANDEDCVKRCEGDVNQLCGGGWRSSVFKTPIADVLDAPEAGKYIGCYKDQIDSRSLDGYMQDFGNFLTPFKCSGLCYSKGFLYSGTQFSYQCFCGDKPPNPVSKVAERECNKPCSGNPAEICGGEARNSIRETGIPDVPVGDKYLGCFNDVNNQIYGVQLKFTFDKTNSPRRCMNYCSQLGYHYSGVEYGKECFCGNEKPKDSLVTNPEECSKACSGDPEESCGSDWRLAVYATSLAASGGPIVTPVKHTTSRPCDPSETVVTGKNSVCRGDVIFEDQFNTPLGNKWSHVVMIPDNQSVLESYEKSGERQTNQKRKRSTIFPKHNSSLPMEEHVEFLGIKVDTNVNLNKVAEMDENSIFGEMVASRIEKLNCNNQADARNRINNLLSELEQEELSTSKKIPSLGMPDENSSSCPQTPDSSAPSTSSMPQDIIEEAEDIEFAVYTANPENSFTRKNRLIIKPTFYDDIFVQTGFLKLNGCTGRPGSRQCELQAVSYNILPPLASARIHTRNSFSFRYGIVEIRAKLPLGDWLVPELWLEPQDHYYGSGYASGRIRIAMNRGNTDFKCHEEEFGSSLLESGVVMGPADNVQKRSLSTKLPANWHDHFHNYTLIWAPGSISFKIDNGQAQELIPTGRKLCEVIGFQNEECLNWSSGSKIAPFDKDFHISLGLSVGNARDFPDGCTNRGRPKPWKNTDPKAMLNFWKDKENWKATWTEDSSSLYVEHIRVTAL